MSYETICYLCRKQAWGKDIGRRDLLIICSECSSCYELSGQIIRYYTDKQTKQLIYKDPDTKIKGPLTHVQIQNILNYIHQNQNWEEKKPTKIGFKIYKNLIEKK